MDDSIPTDGEETADDSASTEEDILQPLKTMKGDLARLLRDKKISDDELGKLDKRLRREATAYGQAGGDEEFAKKLKFFLDEQTSGGALEKSMSEEVSTLIQDTGRDFLMQQISRARERTAELASMYTEKNGDGAREASGPVLPPGVKLPPPIGERQPIPNGSTPPELPHEKPSPAVKLRAEELKIERELAKFPAREKEFEDVIAHLESQRMRLLNFVEPIRAKEKELEDKEVEIEAARAQVTTEKERRELEERRWIVEDRRREAEQQRWKTDQEIVRIQNEIKNISAKKEDLLIEKAQFEEKMKTVRRKMEALTAEAERAELVKKLDVVEKLKEPLELQFISITEKTKRSSGELKRLSAQVESLKDKIAGLGIKERAAETAEEQHNFEVERWNTEEELRRAEKALWQIEDSGGRTGESVTAIKTKYQKILAVENALHAKIKELEALALETDDIFAEL